MKTRILNCLSVLLLCAVWVVLILFSMFLCRCNSSRHLQQQSTHTDSTVVQHHDSVAVSTSRTEERQGNERIMEMLFGMQQAIDARGQPVINTYPTSLRIIDRSGTEKIATTKDSTHEVVNDTASKVATVATVTQTSSTRVFPLWWLFATGGACLVLGFATRFFKISKR